MMRLASFLLAGLLQAAVLHAAVLQAEPQAATPQAPQAQPAAGKSAKPATVRGHVSSQQTGASLKRAQVSARLISRPLETVAVNTDAQGNYEFKKLEPGLYQLTASKSGYVPLGWKAKKADEDAEELTLAADQVVKDVDFALIRAGVIAGSLIDEDGEPISGVNVQALAKHYSQGKVDLQPHASAKSDDRGNFRIYDLPPGRYYVQANAAKDLMSMISSGGKPQADSPYTNVIYPSATRIADAQAVTITAGAEVNGINMVMREAAKYSVSGKIMDSRSGKPVPTSVVMVSPVDSPMSFSTPTQTRDDGSFQLSNLSPGSYRMMIANVERSGSAMALPVMRSLEVGQSDITGMVINLGPGATLRGKLKADGGDFPKRAQVILSPHDLSSGGGPGFAVLSDTGTFEIADVQQGLYDLRVDPGSMTGASSEFFLRDISLGGHDVTDTGIAISDAGGIVEMSATLDFRGGSVSGVVTDDDSKPVQGVTVALISADAKKRSNSRYFDTTHSDSTGSYKLKTIVPGDYLLVVWPEGDAEQLQDPDVFALVEKFAVAVTVQGSATATQALTLSKDLKTVAQTFAQ